MRRILSIAAAVVIALALTGAAPAVPHEEGSTSYTAPYPEGSQGGDDFNLIHRGEDGRMAIARAYPVVSVLSCDAEGGYTNYRVVHTATGPVDHVDVAFSEAAVDPYTFVVLNVTDADGTIIGTYAENGPVLDAGTFSVPVEWDAHAPMPRDITIEFGLSVTSACPSADAGTVKFDSVTVSPPDHG